MTRLDWVIVAVVAVTALLGLWQGLTLSALSAAGVIAGAVIGARAAPHLLADGAESPYTPLVALGGAAAMALLLELVGSSLGSALKRRFGRGGVGAVDSAGGFAFGAISGLAVVWVLGVVALQLPGQPDLRREVQRSSLLRELNEIVPPRRALRALARVDPFPSIAGPAPDVGPPDASILRRPGVGRAAASVVRVLGTACGLGVTGSGWVVEPGLVVTNAHVVAGQRDTTIDSADAAPSRAAVVAFDTRNDIAILRVDGLAAPPLRQADPEEGAYVAVLGYSGEGPLDVRPARIGGTASVLSEDAYGRGPVTRSVTAIRGEVRRGNSGGPVVDSSGRVRGTIFASRTEGGAGYAVPPEVVARVLARAGGAVSTGDCAR